MIAFHFILAMKGGRVWLKYFSFFSIDKSRDMKFMSGQSENQVIKELG